MRDFFLIQHHPRGLTEAYQENSRRTRAPRHTLPACAGRYDDEGVISLRQRVVNGMQSEGRVVSHLTDDFCIPFQSRCLRKLADLPEHLIRQNEKRRGNSEAE